MTKRPLKPQSSTASSQEVAKPQASKSRRCTGKQRDPKSPAKPDGVASKSTRTDPWDPSGSIASVFGEEESGARLIEKIFSTYGDPKDYITVAWFAEDGSGRPNLVADPLNRPLQLSTVCDYKNRIFQSGLAEDCSGLPWLRWSKGPKQNNFPLLCLSFNHRRQAFYDAFAEQPENPQVKQTLKTGLRRARVLHKDTPDFIVDWLCSQHNLHHAGSGETPLGIVEKALKVESSWKRRCSNDGLTTRHPDYQKLYDSFVRGESALFKDSITAYSEAKILGHALESWDIYGEFEEWHLASGDFLAGVPPTFSISMMTAMANVVVKAMKDFHPKSDIKIVLLEALKFCVPKVADGAQRSIPYVFDTRATTNMMANIAIPMGDSSTFKKMLRKKEQLEERQAVEEKMETSGLSGLSKTVPAPQKQTTQTTREAEEGASSDEEEDDDEDGATTAPTEAVAAASVDLAVKALKTAKEHTISKRIQKKKKEKEMLKRKQKKKGSSKNICTDQGPASATEAGKATRDLQECLDFSVNISVLKAASCGAKETQRVKHALDDFLCSLKFARENLAIEISKEEADRSKKFLVSLFLELSWASSVAINGKIFRTYSQFREETQKVFYVAHQRLKVGQQEYDPLQLAKDLMSVVQAPVAEPKASDGNDEEGMLACVKDFDPKQAALIRDFVESQIKQPPALQDLFFKIRPQISSSKKHFQSLGSLTDQLKYLSGLFQDHCIFPKAWLTFASSTSYLLKKVGRFVEGTGSIFPNETALGIFMSLRAKYVLLVLKDLLMMKTLKCNSVVEKAVMDMNSLIESSDPEKDDDFSAALAAFDCELAQRGDKDWELEWQKFLDGFTSAAEVPKLLRSMCGVFAEERLQKEDQHEGEDEGSGERVEESDMAKQLRKLRSVPEEAQDEPEEDQERAIESALMKPLILAKNINVVYPFAFEAFEEVGTDYTVADLAGMNMSAPWVKCVEKGLESIIWRLFHRQRATAENHLMFVADGPAAGLKAEKVVLMGAPEGIDLMFAGSVTTEPGVNSLKIAEISGITFYINPVPAPPSGEVLVPAWLAKPTPKKDLITVKSWTSTVSIYIDESGAVSTTDPEHGYSTSLELYRVQISAGQQINALRDQLHETKSQNASLNDRLEEKISQLELLQARPSCADSAVQTELGTEMEADQLQPPHSLEPTLPATQPEGGIHREEPAEPAEGAKMIAPAADPQLTEATAMADDVAKNFVEEAKLTADAADTVPESEKKNQEELQQEDLKKKPEKEVPEESEEAQPPAAEEAQQTGTSPPGAALDAECDAAQHAEMEKRPEQNEPRSPSHLSDLKDLFEHGESESDYEMPDSLQAAIDNQRSIKAAKAHFLTMAPKVLNVDMTLHMLTTTRDSSGSPMPLLRAMTPEEVSAKASRTKREAPDPDVKLGLAGAVRTREMLMEKAGQETAAMKKRRKKEEVADKSCVEDCPRESSSEVRLSEDEP